MEQILLLAVPIDHEFPFIPDRGLTDKLWNCNGIDSRRQANDASTQFIRSW